LEFSVDTVLPSLSPFELADLLGRPDAPLLLDVRRRERFAASDRLLPAAMHCAPEDIADFAARERPRDVIVYCAYGHEVGCEAARALRLAGWSARYLLGGIEAGENGVDRLQDIAAWRSAPLPTIRKRADLGVTGERPSRWITRERPKIDRIACPWLILRFIDPRAEFFYVPEPQLSGRARELAATPFDVHGAPVTHEWGRCSFDALLHGFDLHMPALDRLADIVRGADTLRFGLAGPAAGLLAISLGLSRVYRDDQAMLRTALPLYDALYAWCRDGQQETHGWASHEPQGTSA
jgi:rhodanese-related sulfurtransferase